MMLVLSRKKKDHPRRCGEKLMKIPRYAEIRGSPPQVRGKEPPENGSQAPIRITPAGAGKRFLRWVCLLGMRDHPRRCGEKLPS